MHGSMLWGVTVPLFSMLLPAAVCLPQSLVTGMGDEVRLGRGFMFWGVTMSLTEEGLKHTDLLLEATYQALGVRRA